MEEITLKFLHLDQCPGFPPLGLVALEEASEGALMAGAGEVVSGDEVGFKIVVGCVVIEQILVFKPQVSHPEVVFQMAMVPHPQSLPLGREFGVASVVDAAAEVMAYPIEMAHPVGSIDLDMMKDLEEVSVVGTGTTMMVHVQEVAPTQNQFVHAMVHQGKEAIATEIAAQLIIDLAKKIPENGCMKIIASTLGSFENIRSRRFKLVCSGSVYNIHVSLPPKGKLSDDVTSPRGFTQSRHFQKKSKKSFAISYW